MRAAVVGAGWAGLAAALDLADAGAQVTLYEAAPMAGGRARSASIGTPLGRFTLDNGQHLVVGAYRDTLALIERLGASAHLHRHRLHLASPSGLSLHAAHLPAPLHLAWAVLTARGLGPGARLSMLRLMTGLRRARWQVRPGETVAGLMHRHGQPDTLVDRLWSPLCIGALNTLPEAACAGAFAAVLRDTLGAGRAASDFVGADAPLGALLPEPALARLGALGAVVRLRWPVRRLERRGARWRALGGAPGEDLHDTVVLALPPWSAARLLEASGLEAGPIGAFEPEPIATAWALWHVDNAPPSLPRWSLLDEDPVRGRHGQWLFDRGVIRAAGERAARARVAGVVVSVASRIDGLSPEAVSAGVSEQIQEAFGGPPPAAMRLLTEHRATFRCTPHRPRLRPDHFRDCTDGLWLAGDWLWPDYPATLEAAVRSGQAAAAAALRR